MLGASFRYVGRLALGQLSNRPVTTLASAALAALMLGIAMNALIMQHARHPAPLFAKAETEPTGSTKPDVESPPPVPKHAHAPSKDAISQYLNGEPMQRPPATLIRAARKPEPLSDTLGDYIKTKLTLPGKPADVMDKAIVTVQRELAKLGYAVKPTGILGNATKQAIMRFQKDHGLPETGELTPRLQRALAGASADAQ